MTIRNPYARRTVGKTYVMGLALTRIGADPSILLGPVIRPSSPTCQQLPRQLGASLNTTRRSSR